jgi:hypothetical protein
MMHVIERCRITPAQHPLMGSDASYGNNGAFALDSVEPGWSLLLICSDGTEPDAVGELAEWEHVSVRATKDARPGSEKSRIPTWREMCHVKTLLWDDEDVVVQYHPRASEYVNQHPHVLHLWRWKAGAFPTPPVSAV